MSHAELVRRIGVAVYREILIEGFMLVPRRSQSSIACPRCERVSWNRNDVEHGYCGNCHQYHIDMVMRDLRQLEDDRPK